MKKNRSGNGLFAVILLLTAIAFGVYSVSRLVTGESILNKRNAAYLEAKQAAEMLVKSGVAELAERLQSAAISSTSNNNSDLAISPRDGFKSIHTDSEDLKLKSYLNQTFIDATIPMDNFQDASTALSKMPTAVVSYFIDRDDVQVGDSCVVRRRYGVISKASVNRPPVGEVTVYAQQLLETYQESLFQYAIFYNMPMEIAPGKTMTVSGSKVHVNGDAWVQSSEGLSFTDGLFITGNLKHGRRDGVSLNVKNGDVKIADMNLKISTWDESMQNHLPSNYTKTWYESGTANDYQIQLSVFDNMLQTGAPVIATPGIPEYVEGSSNSAYPIIQPVLSNSDYTIDSSDSDSYKDKKTQMAALERLKGSYRAGLTIKIERPTPSDPISVKYFTYERDQNGNIVFENGQPKIIELTPDEDDAAPLVKSKKYNTNPGSEDIDVTQFFDYRQGKGLDLVELDVGNLAESLHNQSVMNKVWGTDANKAPEKWWNGIVYVEFPLDKNAPDRDDGVRPAIDDMGLMLVNGNKIPNPRFAYQDGTGVGTSIITNQQMYVRGHYNADGLSSTGSPTSPDNRGNYATEGKEAPSALVADSITFLSPSWKDTYNQGTELSDREAEYTEVSAAIMTGLVPSARENYSGGVENFPRFLEKWNNITFSLRGSMVAFFESEVGDEQWGKKDVDVYSPPNRSWGFNEMFKCNGRPEYDIPLFDYVTRDFAILSEQEFMDTFRNLLPEDVNNNS